MGETNSVGHYASWKTADRKVEDFVTLFEP
jgi:hypothetical protein